MPIGVLVLRTRNEPFPYLFRGDICDFSSQISPPFSETKNSPRSKWNEGILLQIGDVRLSIAFLRESRRMIDGFIYLTNIIKQALTIKLAKKKQMNARNNILCNSKCIIFLISVSGIPIDK